MLAQDAPKTRREQVGEFLALSKSGAVEVHVCNPALRRYKQEDRKFKATLCYIISLGYMRPCIKKKRKNERNHVILSMNVEKSLIKYINPTLTIGGNYLI